MKWIGQIVNDVKVNFSNDGEIYVIGDDLYIENVTQDKDIIFKTNDGGTATEVMRIDGSTSSIGIGTSSPSAKLDIVSASATGIEVNTTGGYFAATFTTDYDNVARFLSSDSDSSIVIQDSNSTNNGNKIGVITDDMYFKTNAAEKMRITSAGNVGIGTTSPSAKFHINVDSEDNQPALLIEKVSDNNETALVVKHISSSNIRGIADFQNTSGSVMKILADGNVGIGTTSPASLLHVAGTVQVGVDDTGHDVIFYGATSGRSMLWDESYDGLILSDNTKLQLGSSTGYGDLQLLHDGTNSYVKNHFGNLYIMNNTDDGDIIFQSDDGSGGVETYFFLDGSAGGSNPRTVFPDDSRLCLGSGHDLKIFNNGSDSFVSQETDGDLYIRNIYEDKDVIFQSDDGSGGETTYFQLDGGEGRTVFKQNALWEDSKAIYMGNGADLRLYHNGSNSFIENHLGNLTIDSAADDADIIFKGTDGGADITALTLDMSDAGTAIFNHDIKLSDSSRAYFGNSLDVSMFHNGTNSYIDNNNGDFYIRNYADDKDIIFQSDDGSGGVTAYLTLDGSATRTIFNENAQLVDSKYLYFGTGSDAHVRHDGSNFSLTNTAGNINILNATDDGDIIFQADDGSGGNAEYLKLDGGYSSPQIIVPDNVALNVGSGLDFNAIHNGSNTTLTNNTGNLTIKNNTDDGDIIFSSDDGSGGTTAYLTLDGSAGTIEVAKVINSTSGITSGGIITADTYFLSSDTSAVLAPASNGSVFLRPDGYGSGTGAIRVSSTKTYFSGAIDVGVDDTGHDVKFFGATSGRYMLWDQSADFLKFSDNAGVYVGSSNDAAFWHNGTDTFIENFSGGNLYIDQEVNDADIVLRCDDGSGGLAEYIRLDGGVTRTIFSKHTQILDGQAYYVGTGTDGGFYASSDNVFLEAMNGDMTIVNYTNDKDIIFQSDDGSGGTTTYFSLDGSTATHDGSATTALFTIWPDNSKIAVGAGKDGRFWHNGTNTYLQNNTGDFYITNFADDKDIIFQATDASGGTTTYFYLDGSLGSGGYTIFPDNTHLGIGNNADLRIKHDGTDSIIQEIQGDLYIKNSADDKDIILQSDNGSGGTTAYLTLDGSAGYTTVQKQIRFDDSVPAKFGTGNDLHIFHDGTDSLVDNYTGDLYFRQTADDKDIIFQSDDGAGGLATYFYLDGSSANHDGSSTTALYTNWPDNSRISLGSSHDFSMKHTGSDTHQENLTGDLYFTNYADDKDIILRSDDGSGGVTPYLTLDGSAGHTVANKEIQFLDNVVARFGTGNDLAIYHTGTATLFDNNVGNMSFRQYADDGDIIFQSDDGSGGTTNYLVIDGSAEQTRFYKDTRHTDGIKANLGNADDLQIYHNGTNSNIINFTGDLVIRNGATDKDVILQCDDGSGGETAYLTLDGSAGTIEVAKDTNFAGNVTAVNLNLTDTDGGNLLILNSSSGDGIIRWQDNGTQKWDIGRDNTDQAFVIANEAGLNDNQVVHINHSTGEFTLKGALTVGVDDTGHDVKFFGAASGRYMLWDESENALIFTDNARIRLGGGSDLELYHNGTDSIIQNNTGDLKIINYANDKDITLSSDDGSGGTTAYLTLDGTNVRTKFHKNVNLEDNVQLQIGNSQDLKLYHSGTHSYISQEGVGNLYIQTLTDDGDIIFMSDDGSGSVEEYFRLDGSSGGSNAQTIFPDNSYLLLGTGSDLELFHNGTNSYIDNNTGDLYIRQEADDKDIIFQSDDGSGGLQTYMWMDGSAANGTNTYTRMDDGSMLGWGSGFDMYMFHTGTHSYLTNATGNLEISAAGADTDIILKADNGSGTATAYLALDGGLGFTQAQKKIRFIDDVAAEFGSQGDFTITHNGSHLTMNNSVGNITIRNYTDDGDIVFQSDDGSGGTTTYLTIDGGSVQTKFYKSTEHQDDIIAGFGAGFDLQLYHNGTDSFVDNITGDLKIRNFADDKDIIFQSDSGNGGIATYFSLDGSSATHDGSSTTGLYTNWPDKSRISMGNSNDLQIYHDGTNSNIINAVGNLAIQNNANDGDIKFFSDDGSGGVTEYFRVDGGAVRNIFSQDVSLTDSVKLMIGSSNDLQVFHDGTNTLVENYVGNLTFEQRTDDADMIFKCDNGSGGTTAYLTLDGSAGHTKAHKEIQFEDNVIARFGAGNDMSIQHNGTDSLITNNTGDLYIQNTANDKDIIFQSDNGAGGNATYFSLDGSLATHDGSATTSLYTNWPDKSRISMGTGHDLQIEHDGTDSNISNYVGDFYIQNQADDKDIIFKCDDGSGGTTAYLTLDGSAAETKVDKDMRFSDNVNLRIGTNSDVVIVHDNSNFTTTNYTGNYNIINQQVDGDIVFQTDDGSGGVETYLTIDGGSQEIIATKPIVTGETQIKVLPHHFMSNEDGGANKSAQFRDDTIIGVRTSSDDAELYAFVEIPYGKTARTVTVYGNDTSLVVNVYESDINAGALTDKTPGAGCVVGTECDITDVAYSATNYLVIKVTTVSYTNDIVYGAVVTIG